MPKSVSAKSCGTVCRVVDATTVYDVIVVSDILVQTWLSTKSIATAVDMTASTTQCNIIQFMSVSYTHLTLPTIYSV